MRSCLKNFPNLVSEPLKKVTFISSFTAFVAHCSRLIKLITKCISNALFKGFELLQLGRDLLLDDGSVIAVYRRLLPAQSVHFIQKVDSILNLFQNCGKIKGSTKNFFSPTCSYFHHIVTH